MQSGTRLKESPQKAACSDALGTLPNSNCPDKNSPELIRPLAGDRAPSVRATIEGPAPYPWATGRR